MQHPDILTIQENHAINPLCGYTTQENLVAWYRDFQTMGCLAVQWIQVARQQTLQLGPGMGWNWEAWHSSRLEYPERWLITERFNNSFSKNDSKGSDSELGSWEEEAFMMGEPESAERCLVLHPTRSTYAKRYPNFNSFAG